MDEKNKCRVCGAYIGENDERCVSCGAPVFTDAFIRKTLAAEERREAFKRASAFLVLLLLIDAAAVFTCLVLGVNQWLLVWLYWAILTVKNALDFFAAKEGMK